MMLFMKVSMMKFQLMCEAVEWLLANSGYDMSEEDTSIIYARYKYCRKQVYIIANEHLSLELLDANITSYQIGNIETILRGWYE